MSNLTEEAVWEEGVYQLETTDPVKGGAGGISNRQAEQLANRTVYLKLKIDELDFYTTEEVNEKITSLKESIAQLEYDFSVYCPFPVGCIQTFGNEADPRIIWPGTQWQDLNETYNGRTLSLGYDVLGIGGSDTTTLDISQMPNHGHTVSGTTESSGAHTHSGVPASTWTYELGGDNTVRFHPNEVGGTDSSGEHAHLFSGTTDETGGGQPIGIVSSYLHVRGWMRIA